MLRMFIFSVLKEKKGIEEKRIKRFYFFLKKERGF